MTDEPESETMTETDYQLTLEDMRIIWQLMSQVSAHELAARFRVPVSTITNVQRLLPR